MRNQHIDYLKKILNENDENLDVANKSTSTVEKGTVSKCPRCKGHGSTSQDKGENCKLCKGEGEVVKSPSGWVRPVDGDPEDSELY